MLAERIVGHLAPDQGIAHFARAVADAVGCRDRVLRLDKAQLELVRPIADAAIEMRVNRLDLGHDTEIALAVTLRTHNADRGLVDELRIGTDLARNPNGLGRASWMAVDQHNV
jgi:hypothetical protein